MSRGMPDLFLLVKPGRRRHLWAWDDGPEHAHCGVKISADPAWESHFLRLNAGDGLTVRWAREAFPADGGTCIPCARMLDTILMCALIADTGRPAE